ncbi:DUF2382 domain-containing protein [Rufibacter glacialis]|nr:PRC and DUF2382 domain-containing protein [Rufibacter glacialis]
MEYHLQELGHSDFSVAKGEEDIRGWKVSDRQGNLLGNVKELLCDPQARKVRYAVVDLTGNALNLDPRPVLVPIGLAQLHAAEDVVTIPEAEATQWQALPTYHRHTLNQEMERAVQRVFSGETRPENAPVPQGETHSPEFYRQEQFNQRNLYRNRGAKNVIGLFPDAESVARVTRELTASGFSEEDIDAAVRPAPGAAGRGDTGTAFDDFFYSLFSTQEEAATFEEKLHQSQALVVVRAFSPEEANRAAAILNTRRGAELDIQVEKTAAQTQTTPNFASSPVSIPVVRNQDALPQQETGLNNQEHPFPQRESLHQEPQSPTQEHVHLEQIPFDRTTTEPGFGFFQEGTLELKEFAEVPVLTKEAHVVEEITIAKDVEIQEETIYETVRKTDIQIEGISPQHNPSEPTPPS